MIARATTLALAALIAVPATTRAAPDEAPIPVKAVTASSALPDWKGYTFGAANLIDGRVDTSWQPAKSDTMGIGQWIELDLGDTFEVTSVEIAPGLQREDELGDLFCRNNRPASLSVYFDDGRKAWKGLTPGDRLVRIELPEYLKPRSAVTRRVLVVIESVFLPVDWKDPAIAEVRVFGRPARPKASQPTDAIACGSAGFVPFHRAVVRFCAEGDAAFRARHNCRELVSALAGCDATVDPYDSEPVSAADLLLDDPQATRADYRIGTMPWITHTLHFSRKSPKADWTLATHTCGEAGEAGECGGYGDDPPSRAPNACWKKLGKKQPELGPPGPAVDPEPPPTSE
ncbi:MAG: discoidin domain-containing protein [Deltaproteobacteria bacterium]|nr:discoidin domain-containing protein [Deltaproteobacteria bacterium]